jgi:hypothetical protein
MKDQVQWVEPVIPATWEMYLGGSWVKASLGKIWKKSHLNKQAKCVVHILATWEVEVGASQYKSGLRQ